MRRGPAFGLGPVCGKCEDEADVAAAEAALAEAGDRVSLETLKANLEN